MPYSLFHKECKELKYDLELLQNTFATSFEQVAHRVTCLQDPKLPGIPFHFLRVFVAPISQKDFHYQVRNIKIWWCLPIDGMFIIHLKIDICLVICLLFN